MKHLSRIVLACVIIAAVFKFSPLQPVSADSCVIFDETARLNHEVQLVLQGGHTYNFYRNGLLIQVLRPTITTTTSFLIQGEQRTVIIDLGPCGGGNGVTFFNPGDGRLDPRPGDHIAVYCNMTANPPTIDVWSINGDSQGHRLFNFSLADLLRASGSGITRNVPPLGSVRAQIDANGYVFVQWFGGPAGATGSGDFAKAGLCGLPAVQ